MAHHFKVPALSFFVIVYLALVSVAIDGEEVPTTWNEGESAGSIPAEMPSDEMELDEVCKCLETSQPCKKLENYDPIIRDGACYATTGARKRDIRFSDVRLGFPPTFVANKICESTRSIILFSSGTESQLTLTTEASVFVCPGSIEASLKKLNVVNVNKLVISPGAFRPRNSDIFLDFVNVREKIIIPEKAFSVKIIPQSLVEEQIEIGSIGTAPPEVRLEISAVSDIEFKSRSIVAPVVKLKLSNIHNVNFDTKAIIPYVYPEASTFEIANCQSVELAPETVNTGKFEAKSINSFLMKEKAVEVEGKAKLEHITNMTLLDEALSIGFGGDIILDNITIASAGIKSIQSTRPGNIRRAAFSHVTGKILDSVAICIRTETALVFNVQIAGRDGKTGACLQGQEYHADAIPKGVVICNRAEVTGNICGDQRCEPCTPDIKGAEVEMISQSFGVTTTITPIAMTEDTFLLLKDITASSIISELATLLNSTLEDVIVPVTMASLKDTSNFSVYGELNDKSDDSKSSFLKSLEETPVYIIILFFCAVIILVLFMTYMIYKCCTRNKHDKYNLPQENRLSTFRNPRTITTPENLADQNMTHKVNNPIAPEVYSTYDSYGRRPTATYIAHSETLDSRDSASSITGRSAPHGDVVSYFKVSSSASSINSSQQETCPHNSDHHDISALEDLTSENDHNDLHEVQQDNNFLSVPCLPHPSQVPPPEGYLESDDQIPNNFTPSRNICSRSESSASPVSFQHSPGKLDHNSGDTNSLDVHESVDCHEQSHCQNEIPLQNKFSSMELPMYAPPPIPAINRVESDGDELII